MMWVFFAISAAFFNALWTSLTKNKDENVSALHFTVIFRFLTCVMLLPIFLYRYNELVWTNKLVLFAVLYAIVEGLRTTVIVKGANRLLFDVCHGEYFANNYFDFISFFSKK